MSSGLDKTFRRVVDQFARPKPNSLLYNRFVLYFVFFIALGNLFLAAFQNDYLFCIYFILIGFILSFFNKNMIVVLVLTLAFANILRVSSSREGMETKEPMKEGADNTLEYSDVKEPEKQEAPKKEEAKTEKTKSEMVDAIKKDAEKLIDTQNKIIGGFEKIDPYMKQAEQLIEKIDSTAKQIDGINKSKLDEYKKSN